MILKLATGAITDLQMRFSRGNRVGHPSCQRRNQDIPLMSSVCEFQICRRFDIDCPRGFCPGNNNTYIASPIYPMPETMQMNKNNETHTLIYRTSKWAQQTTTSFLKIIVEKK